MFFLKYQDGIFQKCANFVSIILSQNFIFWKSQFSCAKHFVKKNPLNHSSNTTHSWLWWGHMVPSFLWVGWDKYCQNTVKYWCLTHSGTVLANVVTDHTGQWDYTHSEKSSSIVRDPKDLGTDLMLRDCAVLWLGQRAATSCVGGQGNVWQIPDKDGEEASSTLSKLPLVCHWKANPSFHHTNRTAERWLWICLIS